MGAGTDGKPGPTRPLLIRKRAPPLRPGNQHGYVYIARRARYLLYKQGNVRKWCFKQKSWLWILPFVVKSWEEEEGMRRGGKGKGGKREGRKGMKGGRSRECREVEEGRKLGKRKK